MIAVAARWLVIASVAIICSRIYLVVDPVLMYGCAALVFAAALVELSSASRVPGLEAVGLLLLVALLCVTALRDGAYAYDLLLLISLLGCLVVLSRSALSASAVVMLLSAVAVLFLAEAVLPAYIENLSPYAATAEAVDELYGLTGTERLVFLLLGKSNFLVNANEVGFFACAGLLVVHIIRSRSGYNYWTLESLLLILLVVSHSRSALILSAALFAITGRKLHLLFVLLVAAVLVTMDQALLLHKLVGVESTSERLALLLNAVDLYSRSPLSGTGLTEYYQSVPSGPHNEYLYALVRGGPLFLCVQAVAIALIFRFSVLPLLLVAYLSFFTHNLLDSLIYIPVLMLLSRVARGWWVVNQTKNFGRPAPPHVQTNSSAYAVDGGLNGRANNQS